MNNDVFLAKISESFSVYLETGSRSNKKLKILHGAIAHDLKNKLGNEYEITSLGYKDDKEISMPGRYMDKKVDIGIIKNNEIVGALAVKFVMRNYSQNSNNYFENMLGETANIRTKGLPYYQIIIVPSKIPYFNKDKIITNIEKLTEHNLSKYINLSHDDISEFMHAPNKTLLYIIDVPEHGHDIKKLDDYISFYQKYEHVLIKTNTKEYDFGKGIVHNDYERFIKEIIEELK